MLETYLKFDPRAFWIAFFTLTRKARVNSRIRTHFVSTRTHTHTIFSNRYAVFLHADSNKLPDRNRIFTLNNYSFIHTCPHHATTILFYTHKQTHKQHKSVFDEKVEKNNEKTHTDTDTHTHIIGKEKQLFLLKWIEFRLDFKLDILVMTVIMAHNSCCIKETMK